jgi:hypothetical protein
MAALHTALDIESHEIRILWIYPGQEGSTIRCRLQKESLVEATSYAALSYCWGDTNNTTNIVVNNAITPVTANLHDALMKLRSKGVSRVWADALCINQADDQEKSLQIRNMKQIYARAEQTYPWIGGTETDNAALDMALLRNVIMNGVSLGGIQHSHRHVENGPAPRSVTHCQRCQLFSAFRSLEDLCNREYWKSGWIIQEIAAAQRVLVLCGSEALSIDDIEAALARCSKSEYWLPTNDNANIYLHEILDIRKTFQSGKAGPLCIVILRTRNFLSRDSRDGIFALIGICSDGAELVPTPSYHQTIETILRDLCRALIRKNVCFDIILLDERQRSSSDNLPIWVPDWVSQGIPIGSDSIVNRPPRLNYSLATNSLTVESNTIRVEGVTLGTITSLTSILGDSTPNGRTISRQNFGTLETQHPPSSPRAKRSQERPQKYYGSSDCQGFPNRSTHSRQSSGIASVSRLSSRSEGTEERAVKPASGENLRRKIKGEVITRDEQRSVKSHS